MKLRVLREALAETEEAYQYYEDKQIVLGEGFLAELEEIYERIEKVPRYCFRMTIAGLEDREFRRAVLHRFPYRVVFEILEAEVVVYAVAHMRRRPNYWKSRTAE